MSGVGMKNGARVVRDWGRANEEKRGEVCRYCAYQGRSPVGSCLELAHLSGREHDFTPAIGYEDVELVRSRLFVAPSRVVPLCGPSVDTGTCHAEQEAGRLDLLPVLTREEEIQAVADMGLALAYRRLSGGAI